MIAPAILPEEWRTILGTDGRYEVSNLGRVRSTSLVGSGGRILKPQPDGKGYFRVVICCKPIGGRNANRRVHQLVAHAFIGPQPEGMEINHINCVKHDNRLVNLEYVTREQNREHARRSGAKFGARNPHRGPRKSRSESTT
jgi:hypothetical protein